MNRTKLILMLTCVLVGHLVNSQEPYSQKKMNKMEDGISTPVEVVIIYDNTCINKNMLADWGYACYIRGLDKDIIFDTGTREKIFRDNFESLELQAKDVDEVVISHEHGDHTGGLWELLKMNSNIKVVVPSTFSKGFFNKVNESGAESFTIEGPTEICKDLYATGVMGSQIPEIALVVNTEKGLVLMTGCSHPGIIEMIKKVKMDFGKDVYMVFGGFHLMQKSNSQMEEIIQEMKDLGVKKCGATHCTGEKQIEMFRKAYGENFVELGAGRVLTIE